MIQMIEAFRQFAHAIDETAETFRRLGISIRDVERDVRKARKRARYNARMSRRMKR